MKKIFLQILTIFFSYILIINTVFWDCTKCRIKDETAPVLYEYIKNLKKIISNITSWINSTSIDTENGIKKNISQTKIKIIQIFNKMINWDWYYSYFDFYVMYSLRNEYIVEIWRDYNILEKESDWLEKYLKYIIQKWFSDINLTKKQVCNWLKNCDFSWNLTDILWEIISNHEKVKNYYRLSIIWKKQNFKWELKIVNNNFLTNFWKYYNEFTTENCSECKWSFSDRLSESIEKISNWQKLWKDWIRSWKEAIAILDWSLNNREYEKLERDLLEKELSRNGTSLKASETILNNLKKYNETWWFSLDNNFITNSFNYVKNSVASQIEDFSDSILQVFKRNKEISDWRENIAIQELLNIKKDLNKTKNVEEKIAEIYNKELPYASIQDNSTQNLQSRIILIHYNLVKAIKILEKTIKVSQKVCNSQASNKWWICD